MKRTQEKSEDFDNSSEDSEDSCDSSEDTEDYSDSTKSDKLYMKQMCKEIDNSNVTTSVDETELLEWYDTSQFEFLLPPDPIRCRQLTNMEDMSTPHSKNRDNQLRISDEEIE